MPDTSPFDRVVSRMGTGSLKWDKYAGRDVVPLWVADMDFVSAPAILDALSSRVQHGVFGYTVPYERVTSAVLAYLQKRHGLLAKSDWLVWLPGLVQGLNLVCRAFGKPGDSVMTCTPVYPPFLSAPVFSDRKRIAVHLSSTETHWSFDWESMERAVTPDTRVFLLCSPHNPVGRVWSKDELRQVVAFCARHQLVLCSDEIHCDLVLEGPDHTPTLSLGPEAECRTITLLSPSKTYNLPGLSCAYAVIPDAGLRESFKRAARGLVTEINAFGYAGCAAAYERGEPWRQSLLPYLRENRDLVYTFAEKYLKPMIIRPMQSTYLAWFDARPLGMEQPCRFFEDAGVGLSNGADFGDPGFVRLNFGCPRSVLQTGLDRMRDALERYQARGKS